LGALAGTLLNAALDRVKARTAAEYWEAQERWKFKANVYGKALSNLRRMRQGFEVAATRGIWPGGQEWQQIVEATNDLTEPSILAALWLSEDAVTRLQTLGDRLLALRASMPPGSDKTTLMRICKIVQDDLDFLVSVAREDLRLQTTHTQTRWRAFGSRFGKETVSRPSKDSKP
jgi:hypothetical protein